MEKEQEELKRQKEQTASSSGKWFTPSQTVCESGGGKREEDGGKKVCDANWEDAKTICSNSGGRLPSIEELKAVVKECGGENVTFGDTNWNSITDRNIANQRYQSCYKNLGFASSSYWSSTTLAGSTDVAWYVGFYDGYSGNYNKTVSVYVRCVRAGQ